MEKTSPVKSVTKALALLDRIALGDVGRQGVTLTELARELRLPVNTAHNLLKSLVASGYVAQQGRGVYAAGPKCAQLGRVAQCGDAEFQRRLLAVLQEFVAEAGEACLCCTLANGERVLVAALESSQAVRVARATVEDVPFFARVTGRLLAALATPAELQQILARQGWPGERWQGIADDAALEAVLAPLRAQGYCLEEQTAGDLVAMACALTAADGQVWGVLASYAPVYRCHRARQRRLLETLRQTAAQLAPLLSRS